MRRVGLDDDRTAGRERRHRVAARHREREREVRGAEHRHRAERHQHPAHVGLRQRLAVGLGSVDPSLHPRALLDQVGEEARLVGGARALALEARARAAPSRPARARAARRRAPPAPRRSGAGTRRAAPARARRRPRSRDLGRARGRVDLRGAWPRGRPARARSPFAGSCARKLALPARDSREPTKFEPGEGAAELHLLRDDERRAVRARQQLVRLGVAHELLGLAVELELAADPVGDVREVRRATRSSGPPRCRR